MSSPKRVASELLGAIRRETGLSQAELARRAGLPRSVVNAYERGTRQPGVDALARIAAAAGMELQVQRPADWDEQVRAGHRLEQVLGLAEALPGKRRGPLRYPLLKPTGDSYQLR